MLIFFGLLSNIGNDTNRIIILLAVFLGIGGFLGGKYTSILADKMLERILIVAIVMFALILFLR